jgi:hypothetical protein
MPKKAELTCCKKSFKGGTMLHLKAIAENRIAGRAGSEAVPSYLEETEH